MFEYLAIGMVLLALLGTGANAMSILPFGKSKTVNTVPMKKEKTERSIRCKGEITLDDRGRIVKCSEQFYLEEEGENVEERRASAKERFLGWLGNFKGMLFWAVVASIGATFLGFGGLVATLWGNLFGGTVKMAKSMVRAVGTIKRNGKALQGEEKEQYDKFIKELVAELEKEQLREGVQKKVDKLRAKLGKTV